MTTLLRSSNLARIALGLSTSQSSTSLHRSLLRASRLSAPRIKSYATVIPKDPKGPKDKKNVAKNANSKGKPARGFESLYDDGSPMSSNKANFQASKLSKEDEEALDNLLAKIELGLPSSQVGMLHEAIQDYKSQGKIPSEVREIMNNLNKHGTMSLATAASLVRVISKISRDYAAKRQAEQMEGSSGAFGKRKSSSSGGGKKSDRKPGDLPSWKDFSKNIDTGTFIAAAFVGYLLYRMVIPGENSKEITFQEFKSTFFDKGLVEKLTVLNGTRVRVDLHREATGRMYPESPAQHPGFKYYFSIGSVEAFERNLEQAQNELRIPSSERIPVTYKSEVAWMSMLMSIGPTFLLIGGLAYMLRRAGGGAGGQSGILGIGKSKAKKFNHETEIGIRFKDVAGMDEAKAEIMEFVSFLKDPGQYQRLGAKIPRGALLSGPPGTGKTLLAKATAGESQVPFFSISGSEFVEIFVGVGASRVRDLFQNARKNSPCIIFIDEIDAVGKARGKGNFGGNDEREGTLNQILTEMDGFNTSEQVVVLAGTNRPDVLDKALLRPGRFDRHIAIDRPTVEGRKQIFNVHLGKIVTNENMEHLTGRLAALTPGFSGADIANCVNEAALIGKPSPRPFPVFLCPFSRILANLRLRSCPHPVRLSCHDAL